MKKKMNREREFINLSNDINENYLYSVRLGASARRVTSGTQQTSVSRVKIAVSTSH